MQKSQNPPKFKEDLRWTEEAYNALYKKDLANENFIRDYLYHIQNIPTQEGEELQKWKVLFKKYNIRLEFHTNNVRGLKWNIEECLWQLMFSYNRLKKLEPTKWNKELAQEIKRLNISTK